MAVSEDHFPPHPQSDPKSQQKTPSTIQPKLIRVAPNPRAETGSPPSSGALTPKVPPDVNAPQLPTASNSPSTKVGQALLPYYQSQQLQQQIALTVHHSPNPSLSGLITPTPRLGPSVEAIIHQVMPTAPQSNTFTRAVTMNAKHGQYDENLTFLADVDIIQEEILKQIHENNPLATVEKLNQSLFIELFRKYFTKALNQEGYIANLNISGNVKTKLLTENAQAAFTLKSFLEAQAEIADLLKPALVNFPQSKDYQLGLKAVAEEQEIVDKIVNLMKILDNYLTKNAKDKTWQPPKYTFCCCCPSTYNKAKVFAEIQRLRSKLPKDNNFTLENLHLKQLIETLTTTINQVIAHFDTVILGQNFPLIQLIANTRDYLTNTNVNYINKHSRISTLKIKSTPKM